MRDLDELLRYECGKLVWKITGGKGQRIAGMEAGSTNWAGYRVLSVNNKKYMTHRVIFYLHHGYFPKLVDHINRDITDNRIENLREVTPRESSLNRWVVKTPGISLLRGVYQVTVYGKYIGRYKTLEEAERSYAVENAKIDACRDGVCGL